MGRREMGPIRLYIYIYIYKRSKYEKGYSTMRYEGGTTRGKRSIKKREKIHTERLRMDGGGGEPAGEKIKFLPTHLLF